jgi:hypothetical protein
MSATLQLHESDALKAGLESAAEGLNQLIVLFGAVASRILSW